MIIFLFLSISFGQWFLLRPDNPPNLSTGPNAQPNKTEMSSMWCLNNDIYVFNEHMWKYEIDTNRWLWQPEVPIPKRRGAAYWTIRNTFYIYGGMGENNTALNDMWMYNPKTREAVQIESGSDIPSYGTSFWTHEQSNRLYMWGGGYGLRAFDVSTNLWTQITSQGNPDNGFFGSAASGGYLYANDRLWKLDSSTYTWIQLSTGVVTPPGPNRLHHVIWTMGDVVYLFGGVSGSKVYSDTWKYIPNSGQWIDMSPAYLTGPKDIQQFSTCGSLYLFLGEVWTFGNSKDLTILQKLEVGLQSATLWAFFATIFSGLVFTGLFGLLFILCVRKCVRNRRPQFMQPLGQPKVNEDDFQL